MCGIVGYIGRKPVTDLILNSLELLEYRGYDSAGIAVKFPGGRTVVKKCAGRVSDLRRICTFDHNGSTAGIGHTRWATHGGVTDPNAHPHHVGKVTLVHNGIIENYAELREEYHLTGELKSETDTEIAAGVLDYFYRGDPYDAIRKTIRKLRGTFSLVILFDDIADRIFAVRNVSPIVAAYTEEGTMLASDVVALGIHARSYLAVPEMEILELRENRISLYDLAGNARPVEFTEIDWDTSRAGKEDYPFYMEKEIMEQPAVLEKTIRSHLSGGVVDLSAEGIPDEALKDCDRICAVACGTAMHAGLIARALVRSRLHMAMDVECASEFMYSDPVIDEKTLVVVISQSGETIDTLAALRFAKQKGAKSIGVINVRGSSIARECDYVIYTEAGPEIAVASTKAYTTQVAALMLLVGRMAYVRGLWDYAELGRFTEELLRAPGAVSEILGRKDEIHRIARGLLTSKDTFMIGRGLDYCILMEGALKLKEVSYIHTEAYASGELKHGTIALITKDTPVVALVTQKALADKELSNIREVQSREASITAFIRDGIAIDESRLTGIFRLPKLQDDLMVFPAVAALQLLAYYVSADRGLDVDKPRNLAKVVTVE